MYLCDYIKISMNIKRKLECKNIKCKYKTRTRSIYSQVLKFFFFTSCRKLQLEKLQPHRGQLLQLHQKS